VVKKFYTDTPSDKANIVAATTNTASTFDKNEFDVGVIDEATQASRPATAIAVKCSKKIVLAGDHKQLPPYSADEGMQNKEMHISLFEYLIKRYGEDITVFLKRQYRMNESIAQFPSEEFYGGRLETAEQNQDWRIKDLKPLVGVDVPGEEKQPQDSNSYYNVPEAKEVAKHVTVLVNRHNVDPSDIGVITAYSGQIPKIKEEINNKNVSGSQHIVVDSIDSFQGAEKEAIIVSFVRCNKDNNSGFLELPNQGRRRLNVAITRARKRLVLIGDWETLATTPTYKQESCAPVYGRLAETMRSNGTMLER
jgi:superfamily I DNA and/or RNA helicase